MEEQLSSLDFTAPLLLDEFFVWMDGGSVTLNLIDKNSTAFSVNFSQRMLLKKTSYSDTPGSFLLNGIEVPIRSDAEKQLLQALKGIRYKDGISNGAASLIADSIAFVESDEYLRVAKLMGRL